MGKNSNERGKGVNALLFSSLLLALITTSCASKKDIVYFQNFEDFAPTATDRTKYILHIVPNDNLLIRVSALNPTAAEPFNVIGSSIGTMGTGGGGNMEWNGYLVDEKGEINFPVIGKIAVSGLTKDAAERLLEEKISQYITNPTVNIRIMNYRITVLGEVNKPGTYVINNEKVSVPQLISLAGDLTILGERRNVQIFRMENGEKKAFTVDLTSPDIFYSPYYYLQQNDLVYISPNKTRIRNAGSNQNLSLIITSVTFLFAIFSFFYRYK